MNFKYSNTTVIKFLKENNFYIPIFQRQYTWDKNQVGDLLDDLYDKKDDKKNHFMGIVHISLFNNDTKTFNIVDGQQRITTFFLILKAFNQIFCERFGEKNKVWKNFIKFTSNKYKNINTKLTSIFNDILNNTKGGFTKKLKDKDNKAIINAYNHIYEILEKNTRPNLQALFDTFKDHFQIGILELKNHNPQDELEYFENMNSKGKGLELHEKIKIFILSRLNNSIFDERDEEAIFKLYNDHFGNIKTLDDFFLLYCRMQKKLLNNLQTKKDNRYYHFKQIVKMEYGDIFESFEAYKKWIFQTSKYLKIYKAIKGRQLNGTSFAQIDSLKYVSHLKIHRGSAILPLVIYLISISCKFSLENKNLNSFFKQPKHKETFQDILEVIQLYLVRNMTFENNKSNSKYFDNLIEKVKISYKENIKNIAKIMWEYFNASNKNRIKTEQEFKNNLESKEIQDYGARWILESIERFKDIQNNVDDQVRHHKIPTLEHIMPQKPKGNEWEDLQNNGLFNSFLNRIGNIAILGKSKNSSLGNKSFEEKKKIFEKEIHTYHIKGTKKPSQLDAIASYNKWDFEAIKKRSKQIANIVANYIFKDKEYK